MKNSGTREHAAGSTEHWLENGREQGTLALKAPGTGNIGPKSAGNREHSMKSNVGITHPSKKEKYTRYYAKVQNYHLRPFKNFFTFDLCSVLSLLLIPITWCNASSLFLFRTWLSYLFCQVYMNFFFTKREVWFLSHTGAYIHAAVSKPQWISASYYRKYKRCMETFAGGSSSV